MSADRLLSEAVETDRAASHFLPGVSDPDGELHVRHYPGSDAAIPVLFIHGATLSSRLYDVPIPGASWMAATADAGHTAYGLDMPGYARSRAPAMARSTEPFGRAEQVTHDIDRTVDWIRNRHGVNQIALVGGSWGSVTSALYASDLGCEKVARLVLYAPIFAERNADWLALLGDPNDQTRFNPDFGASRLVSETQIRQRWDAEIRADMPTEWRDEAVVRAVVDASLDDDPESRGRAGPAFQVPNGAFADLWFCFNGIPIYDPASIRCPVLLLRGGDDTTSTRTDALALLDHLGTSDKRYVEIATGSHFASAERNAGAYFATANAFLGEHAVNSQRFDRPD